LEIDQTLQNNKKDSKVSREISNELGEWCIAAGKAKQSSITIIVAYLERVMGF
jgi:hypothetical protein